MCIRLWAPFFTSSSNLQKNEHILKFLGQIIKKREAFINFVQKWKTFLQISQLLKMCVRDWTTFFTSSWNLQVNELILEFLGQIIKKWEAFNSFFKKMKNVFTNFSFFKNVCSRLDPIFHILVKFARQWAFFGVSRSNNKKNERHLLFLLKNEKPFYKFLLY